MKKIVGLWVLYLGTGLCAFSQVDTSYIYKQGMPYGTLDLRLAKSPTRYYYLQEGITSSYRESSPGVKTNTYASMTTWNTSAYGQGNLREVNGSIDNFVMNYRLLKPQNYNASYSPGYPIIVMIHGGGEAANCWIDARCAWATASYSPVTNSPPAPTDPTHKLLNNDRNLLHGGAQHLTAVNLAGPKLPNDPTLSTKAFPGFVLFPQSLNGWGPHTTVEDAIRILRLIIKKYNIDESRVYIHGLSNGGGGVYQALKRAPWLFAAALPMSAVNDGGIINQGQVPEVVKLPLWVFQGGQDNNPTPGRTYNYVRHFRDAGGNVRYYLYSNLGHGTWNTAYREPDFFSWILEKRKYNPHIYYGDPIICNTTQAGVRMGFSKGFFAYQWQRDGQIIPEEISAEFTANTPGTYRGRFSRKPNPSESDWERWSDPIVVSEMYPEKPSLEVIGTAHLRGPGLASTDVNNAAKLRSADSAELYNWYKNGVPINFPGTDVDDTVQLATFTSAFSGGNGAYTLVHKNSNCPSPPSDPVNVFFNNSSPLNITLNADAIGFKGKVTASSIFLSWNDISNLETGYELWRRRAGTPDFQFVIKTAEDAVSYQDMNLDPATTYDYKLRAVNNSGRSNYVPSNEISVNYTFTTRADYKSPPPPQDLMVVTNTLNSITFSWTAAKDESSVKEYYLYYNNDSISTGSKATTYTLTGLTQNTAYSAKVKALDFGNHFSQPSNQIIATTYLSGLVYKHSTGAWESLDDSAMVATWHSPEFTGTVTNFTLQPRTQEDYFNFQFTGYLNIDTEGTYYFNLTSSDGSRLIIDGVVIINNDGRHGTKTIESQAVFLTAGPHQIEVQYFDDIGVHTLNVRYKGPGIGDGVNFIAIPDAALRSGTYIPPASPAAPSGLTSDGVGMERVDLAWVFADDAQTDYEVYRSLTATGPFEIVARAEDMFAIDSIALIPGTLYYYAVKAVNNNGSSAYSNVTSSSTAADNVPPTVPLDLMIASKTITNLAFTWAPSSDNVGVTGYEIFSGNELIGTSDMQAFTVENLAPNTQYFFTVKAVDASGNRSTASEQLGLVTNISNIFYSLASGNLNEVSTWRRSQHGSGEAPLNFADNGQYFVVSNRTTTSLGGTWSIGGSSSRVIVPAGVTLTVDQPFSANVELQGNAVLNLNHATAPNLVKLSSESTVNFNSHPTIRGNIYGNVILSGSVAKTFDPDTTTILGNLTVNEGLVLKGSPHNSSVIRLSGNLTLNGSRPITAADNAIDLSFAAVTAQSIITGGDISLYRISTGPGKTLSVVNPSGTAIKINLGSLKGGGLVLANGSILNINNHDLIVNEAGVINPAQQTGSINANGGNLMINSASGSNSYLYFDPARHLVNRFTINLTGLGNVTVRSPLNVADGIKIKDGTLASESDITLLASAEKTAVIYQIEDTGKISGEIIVQKRLAPKGTVYHYLSSPVTPVTVSEWQASFPITGAFTGASTGEGLSASPSLFYYRQSTGGWMAYPPSGGSNTAPIEKGLGYAALLRNSTVAVTLNVKGNPYQGSVSFALAAGTPGVSNNSWNLVGNPYASPVLWNNEQGGWTRSGVNNVVAVRNNTTVNGQVRSQVSYYDLSLGGGVIPAGQAFWVKTFTATPALSLQESAKSDPDVQNPVTPSAKHLVVNLKQGEVSDPAYILFTVEGTDGYDPQYDGRKLPNYGMFNFSTITADTVPLAMNNVTNEFCSKTINLNVANVAPGSYSFAFSNLQSLPDIGEIVLVDHFTSSSTTITGADYAFAVTSDPSSFGRSRFALTFTKQKLDTATPQITAADVCAPDPGYVTVLHAQNGVSYQVVNQAGKIISGLVTSNGETIELEILPGELSAGANKVRITAGFAGCERQTFPGEFTLNFISELTATTDADISICEGTDVTLEASGAPQDGFYKWFDGNGVLIPGATSNTLLVSDVLTETVYYVAVAHPNGCESELTGIHIYADTLGMPAIQIKDDTLYTEVVGYYQWKKDGADITGATLHYYVPSESGSYSVVASNGGCYKESDPYVFGIPDDGDPDDGDPDGGDPDDGDPVTGIDNSYNGEFVLNIYPVPSSGHTINVLLRSARTEPVLIEVIDMMGRLHFSSEIEAGVLSGGIRIVPYAPLYNGIYFIRATQADIKARKKIIVKD
ncbi:MAG: fibronectin type III domain-containing protein [Cyclobacteriaceae bacterium]